MERNYLKIYSDSFPVPEKPNTFRLVYPLPKVFRSKNAEEVGLVFSAKLAAGFFPSVSQLTVFNT